MVYSIPVKLPWIFPGAPLVINGASGNVLGNLTPLLSLYCKHMPTNLLHYSDVIMSMMASQITDVSIVYSTVCSGADQRKHQRSASLVFLRGIHRWPVILRTQRASNAENVSIWLRHHVIRMIEFRPLLFQVWLYLGFFGVVYALAFVFSLAFESPMMGLEKVVFRKKRE